MFRKNVFNTVRFACSKSRTCNVSLVSCNFSSNSTDISFANEKDDGPDEKQISLYNYKKYLDKKIPLKVTRMPFMKNLFVGKFDKDVLAFPEILDSKGIEATNKMSDYVRNYVLKNVDSEKIDKSCSFPDTVLHYVKKMGLFGSRLPREYGGLDLSATEHVRLMEACSVDSSLATLINTHHSIAAQGFLHLASDELKNLYLPKVASGELTATLCVSEEGSEIDFSCINTAATKRKGDDFYVLSGKKTLVVGATNADLFLVLAKNLDPEETVRSDGLYSAFLVEKDSPGIVISNPTEQIGTRGANVCSVDFHGTHVPVKNVIGPKKSGHEVFQNISMMSRLHIGAVCSGLAKALVELAVSHCINQNLFLKPLTEYETTQDRVGRILARVYAMESVTYLTAGLFDSTLDPDLNLEYTAVKVFCTEGLWYCVNEVLNLIGPTAISSGHPVERALRDSHMWLVNEGPNDLLCQYITHAGLNHVKELVKDEVEKLRNPTFHPMFSLRKIVEDFRIERGDLSLPLDLQGYLHPSLQISAKYLEHSVQRLKHAFSTLLQKHGPGLASNEVGLRRLAHMAIEIYVMTATCSRSSRAYCIGLPCAETELALALATCHDGNEKVLRLHDEVYRGPAATTDLNYQEISREAFRKQGYCLTPPFTRTY